MNPVNTATQFSEDIPEQPALLWAEDGESESDDSDYYDSATIWID